MKKNIFLFSLFLLFLIPGSVFAQSKQTKQNQIQIDVTQQTIQENETVQEKVELKLETNGENQQIMSQVREEFKERVQLLRDSSKQQILLKIEESLNKANQKLSQVLLTRLDRLQQIANKLDSRLQAMQASGLDVSVQTEQLQTVKDQIMALQEKIKLQLEKSYTPTLNDEATIKAEVANLHQQLQTDLQILRDELISVRQNLTEIIKSLTGLQTND